MKAFTFMFSSGNNVVLNGKDVSVNHIERCYELRDDKYSTVARFDFSLVKGYFEHATTADTPSTDPVPF